MKVRTKLQWVRAEYGGRTHPPVVGLRPGIRFQQRITEWLGLAVDAEIVKLGFDAITWSGTADLELAGTTADAIGKVVTNDSFELLDGCRVIAVGVVVEVSPYK